MPVFVRGLGDLIDFGFGNLVRVHTAQSCARMMHREHDLHGLLFRFAKESRQDFDHKIHRGVIVVQDQHAKHLGILSLGFGFGACFGARICHTPEYRVNGFGNCEFCCANPE